MSKRVTWQGSHDSLCGIYCAADIISCQKTARSNRHDRYEGYFEQAFFQLLKSAEDSGLLTARRIAGGTVGGFTSPQIVRVFNNLPLSARGGLEATAFASSKFKQYAGITPSVERFRGPTFAIVKEDGDRHWIAVVRLHRDGGYHCHDPNRQENVTRRERIKWDDGVMITPEGWLVR